MSTKWMYLKNTKASDHESYIFVIYKIEAMTNTISKLFVLFKKIKITIEYTGSNEPPCHLS